MKQIAKFFGAAVYVLTAGRVLTPGARREIAARRRAWSDHCKQIQDLLDLERRRGYGYRYSDGRRIDF